MKKIIVMNRMQAEAYAALPDIQDTAFISISDIDGKPAVNFPVRSEIVGILRLSFDDVEQGERGCILRSDADAIADFIENIPDDADLVVHCEGGISRSAGVAAAILCAKKGDDSQIFNNGRYCPNMTCYRYVLESIQYGIYDSEQADAKYSLNEKLWKELYEREF